MFGIIDRCTKDARVYCVMNDWIKENLLPLIKKNIYTYISDDNDEDEIEDENNEYNLQIRIYSDCFASYHSNDFREIGYILHKVNHSVWYGQGLFHTNTVEGLWAQLKRLTNDFSGVTYSIIETLEKNGTNFKDYFDGWICYALFLRHIERNHLSSLNAQNYLSDLLKIN